MRLAKQNGVTVLLDGQGADEMLAGYHSYFNEMTDDLLNSFDIRGYLSGAETVLRCMELFPDRSGECSARRRRNRSNGC